MRDTLSWSRAASLPSLTRTPGLCSDDRAMAGETGTPSPLLETCRAAKSTTSTSSPLDQATLANLAFLRPRQDSSSLSDRDRSSHCAASPTGCSCIFKTQGVRPKDQSSAQHRTHSKGVAALRLTKTQSQATGVPAKRASQPQALMLDIDSTTILSLDRSPVLFCAENVVHVRSSNTSVTNEPID